MVIFTTDENSMHGHPDELNCPNNKSRKSIALYFYSPVKPKNGFLMGKRGGTDYRNLNGQKLQLDRPFKKMKNYFKYCLNWMISKISFNS